MIFNFKSLCVNCGKVENYDFYNEQTVYCNTCQRHDLNFEISIKKDAFDYKLDVLKKEWIQKRPKQLFRVGDYFHSTCPACCFKGIIYKEQKFCPVCVKKVIKLDKEVNIGFSLISKLHGEIDSYLNNTTQEKFNNDCESNKIIVKIINNSCEPFTEEDFKRLMVDGEIIEVKECELDEYGIKLIDKPIIEELYAKNK